MVTVIFRKNRVFQSGRAGAVLKIDGTAIPIFIAVAVNIKTVVADGKTVTLTLADLVAILEVQLRSVRNVIM